MQVLNVNETSFGDGLLEALTYGQRRYVWAQEQGEQLLWEA